MGSLRFSNSSRYLQLTRDRLLIILSLTKMIPRSMKNQKREALVPLRETTKRITLLATLFRVIRHPLLVVVRKF
jgi:hypothetical protein